MGDFLWWTFVRCWPLGAKCEVNWDAWAAVGTCAAVVVALCGPAVSRALVRKKADALFAMAYRKDLISALVKLNTIAEEYPFHDTNVSWAVESMLEQEGKVRKRFLVLSRALSALTSREVDLTKWPAVDLNLAAKVVIAIETTKQFQLGAEHFAHPPADRDWNRMTSTVGRALLDALLDVKAANDAAATAERKIKKSSDESREGSVD